MPTPSEIRAQLEAKVEAEKRDETIKAQEFMQKTGSASNQRARGKNSIIICIYVISSISYYWFSIHPHI